MSTPTPPVSKKPLRILGVDPGTARVGWGVIEVLAAGEKGVAYGCIETAKEKSPELRLQQIYEEFISLLREFKPDRVVIERLFFTKNQKTAMSVSEARGVILLAIAAEKLPYLEKTPRQVKMQLTGFGAAEKKQIQFMVKQVLNLDEIPKPDDAADGLALALCGTHDILE